MKTKRYLHYCNNNLCFARFMSCSFKDRTQDFFALTDSIANVSTKLNHVSKQLISDQKSQNSLDFSLTTSSTFTTNAKSLNLRLGRVADQLGELGKLAKNASLFQDSSVQIAQLSANIKKDMQNLSKDFEQLELWQLEQKVGWMGQDKDHAKHVMDNLKSQLAKQAAQFANVLTTRTRVMKEQNSRKLQFSGKSTLPIKRRSMQIFLPFAFALFLT